MPGPRPQGSKAFEHGGPYDDIYGASSSAAKKDERLKSSGRLLGFRFFGVEWGLEPQTAFYDWLYINAVAKNPQLVELLAGYRAFTDIEFDPRNRSTVRRIRWRCSLRSASVGYWTSP